MLTPTRTKALVAATVLASTALLGACSEDESPTAGMDAEELLATAAQTLSDTEGVTVDLTTESLPDGVNGITGAKGETNSSPAFSGSITVSIAGTAAEVPVVSVDGTVYAVLPFTSGYDVVDPTEYGAPDPATLVASDAGFVAVLNATEDAEAGTSVRGGSGNTEVLTPVTGTVDGEFVKQIIPAAAAETFDVEWLVTEDGELRTAEVSGVFYEGHEETTYTVNFTGYGKAAEITAPETKGQ
ncbi:MAG: LppX_LprAFG lipoprotein [Nocardioides sp.]|uniref:LppX_LprAFG lipoprotein n=1 Tax=Nocardioides sp. TaxID=35761 RepID=UPI003F0BB9E3